LKMEENKTIEITREEIDQYLEEEKITNDYYGYVLKKFLRAEGELGEQPVREFIVGYEKKTSRNTVLSALRSLAKWKRGKIAPVGEENRVKRWILERVTLIKGERTITRLTQKELTDDQLVDIFSLLEDPVRFAGIWCLGWFGCRPGELLALKLKHIDQEVDNYLPPYLAERLDEGQHCVKFLTEKTKVERANFMDTFTRDRLRVLIEADTSYQNLRRGCVSLRDEIGVQDFTPKWFRSTFITKMQRVISEATAGTVRPELLSKVMSGHTVSGDIHQVYTDFGTDILRAMTELHFLGDIEQEVRG